MTTRHGGMANGWVPKDSQPEGDAGRAILRPRVLGSRAWTSASFHRGGGLEDTLRQFPSTDFGVNPISMGFCVGL